MPRRDLHKKPYDEGTQDKLKLYREYLREWLPVFINSEYMDTIQIFDFFAGPGIDIEDNPGSPVITCDEIRNALSQHGKQHPKIKVYLMNMMQQNLVNYRNVLLNKKNLYRMLILLLCATIFMMHLINGNL